MSEKSKTLYRFCSGVVLCAVVTGCASLSTETKIEESTWQAMNVVDTMQTLQIAKHPECLREVGTLGWLTGSHPTSNQVVVGMTLGSIAHYLITLGIEKLPLPESEVEVMQRTWQLVNLGAKGATIIGNNQQGIKINGYENSSCQ